MDLELKWYLYYEWQDQGIRAGLSEFSSREELNDALSNIEDPTAIKIISGYTLADRSVYDNQIP